MSHHGIAVSPSEVPLEHFIVEAEPLVVTAQTCTGRSRKQFSSSSDVATDVSDLQQQQTAGASQLMLAVLAALAMETPHLKGALKQTILFH